MRILHVIDSFSPAWGGPPEAVRQLLKASRAENLSVEAVCLDSPRAEFLRGIECPVHALGQEWLGRYAFSPRLWQWLLANAERFDGMIVHGAWTFPGSALRSAARRARKPYGIFVHGALDPWFKRTYPLKHLKKRLYWPVQHAVLRDAAAVFFATGIECELARTSFLPNEWKSVVAPLGIAEQDDAESDALEQIEAFHRAFPALRGRRYLLFLGRIHEKKGCDLLIEAFARVAAMSPEVDLVMAGPDQMGMRARLESRARQLGVERRVHWTGLIGGEQKRGALRACDAFVLPSHQENFGVSVAEALRAGRPVLLSRQVNLWPEIENDGVGLAEADTLEGTVRLLQRWFSLPAAEQAAMASRAQPCFAARLSMKKTVAAIAAAFAA
jgi:glycosyltransferase involved in cell wall biosynthesis